MKAQGGTALNGTNRVTREITARFFPKLYDMTTNYLKEFIDQKGGKFQGKEIKSATGLVQEMAKRAKQRGPKK